MKIRTWILVGITLFTTASWAAVAPIKPVEKASIALKRMMSDMVDKDILPEYCKGYEEMVSSIYTPMKYEMRGTVDDDGEYEEEQKGYIARYGVRLWSSNKEGIPIIKDRSIVMKTQKDKSNQEVWCIALLR
jgi:hypothetical protein